jgi:hypothetical protein
MALVIYHRHTIVSVPFNDENTGRWKFSASISSSQIERAPGARFFTSSPELFIHFEDAEKAGLKVGKNSIESNYGKGLAR